MNIETNILVVVKKRICTGCGLCEAFCPKRAIQMVLTRQGLFEPLVKVNLCNNCAFCLKICGRYRLDYQAKRPTDAQTDIFQNLLGTVISSYRGHSTNQTIRKNATSGGAITAVLKVAFESAIIDCAIVTGSDRKDPTKTIPFVAHNFEDVLRGTEARYAPSPIGRCLPEAMGKEKIAIVGLPCHFESIQKAEFIDESIKNKIVLRLGLFCSHNCSLLATLFVCNRFNLNKKNIVSFKYRGEGWPSGIRIKTTENKEYFLANQNSFWTKMFMSFIFAAPYCLLCSDQTSELADISFGDAWLREVLDEKTNGESIILTRTPIGERLINESVRKMTLEVLGLTLKKTIESQCWPLYFKAKLIHIMRILMKKHRFDMTDDHQLMHDFSFEEKLLARVAKFNAINSNKPIVASFLNYIPSRILEKYCSIYLTRLGRKASDWLLGQRV